MQKLGSAWYKLATWICPFCASMHHAVAACGQGKVLWSQKRLALLPCLVLKLEGALWMRKKGRMKRKEYYFFPLQNWILSLPFLSQKLSAVSGESFKSNLWHVVGAFVFLSFSLLSQGFSKLKLRFHDLVKLTWMWGWHCKDISSTPDCMFSPLSGARSGEQVRDPFAWVIFSLFWARSVLEMS